MNFESLFYCRKSFDQFRFQMHVYKISNYFSLVPSKYDFYTQFQSKRFEMQKVKKDKTKTITVSPLHTYLIKEYDTICDTFQVQLESGSAQINGIDLMKYYPHQYTVPCYIPVFTWQGCTIKVNWKQQDGTKPSDEDWCDLTLLHSHEDPMVKYLELHYELTCIRKIALQELRQGPRLAIVGSEVNGTQLATKIMLNYTGKLNMKPIFVDLDIENSIFIDGTVSSMIFDYKICEDFFDRPEKISFFYGNRRIKRKSFINQATLIAESVNKKLQKELKSYKYKGSNQQCPSFAAGVILHCPRISQKQDKKAQKQTIYQLFKIFQITHVLSIEDSQIAQYLNKKQPQIQKYNISKLQGTSSFIQLPRPIRTKINRYFQPQIIKQITLKIGQIHLYELMEEEGRDAYCREIDIQDEPIAKSTISVLYCENNLTESMEEKGQKALFNPICALAFIYRITSEEIILNVLNEGFWEECKNKLWMSMISKHSSF